MERVVGAEESGSEDEEREGPFVAADWRGSWPAAFTARGLRLADVQRRFCRELLAEKRLQRINKVLVGHKSFASFFRNEAMLVTMRRLNEEVSKARLYAQGRWVDVPDVTDSQVLENMAQEAHNANLKRFLGLVFRADFFELTGVDVVRFEPPPHPPAQPQPQPQPQPPTKEPLQLKRRQARKTPPQMASLSDSSSGDEAPPQAKKARTEDAASAPPAPLAQTPQREAGPPQTRPRTRNALAASTAKLAADFFRRRRLEEAKEAKAKEAQGTATPQPTATQAEEGASAGLPATAQCQVTLRRLPFIVAMVEKGRKGLRVTNRHKKALNDERRGALGRREAWRKRRMRTMAEGGGGESGGDSRRTSAEPSDEGSPGPSSASPVPSGLRRQASSSPSEGEAGPPFPAPSSSGATGAFSVHDEAPKEEDDSVFYKP